MVNILVIGIGHHEKSIINLLTVSKSLNASATSESILADSFLVATLAFLGRPPPGASKVGPDVVDIFLNNTMEAVSTGQRKITQN